MSARCLSDPKMSQNVDISIDAQARSGFTCPILFHFVLYCFNFDCKLYLHTRTHTHTHNNRISSSRIASMAFRRPSILRSSVLRPFSSSPAAPKTAAAWKRDFRERLDNEREQALLGGGQNRIDKQVNTRGRGQGGIYKGTLTRGH